jgi:hypothetical protein
MPNSILTVSYGEEIFNVGDEPTLFQLDSDYNKEIYGEDKSSFLPSETAYLQIIPPNKASFQTSAGTIKRLGTFSMEHTETIDVVNETEFILAYEPTEIISVTWIVGEGRVLWNGRIGSLNNPILGVIRVKYKVNFERISLTQESSFDSSEVIIIASSDDFALRATVNYDGGEDDDEDDGDSSEYTDITFGIRDIGNDMAISGVVVKIYEGEDLFFEGTTEGTGNITIPNMKKGERYEIKLSADGYKSSHTDYLNNDFFVVPFD